MIHTSSENGTWVIVRKECALKTVVLIQDRLPGVDHFEGTKTSGRPKSAYGFMGAGIDYYSHDTRFANDYWDNGSQEILQTFSCPKL